MALLKRIKRRLGIGTGSTDRDAGETTVTVEHEAAATGDADDGETDASTLETVESDGPTAGRPDDGETEAAATGDAVGETAADDDGSTGGAASGDTAPADGSAGVESIKGIGPAYADRLAEIGVETVDDLAAADAGDVAEQTSVGQKRAARWIDRADAF